MSEAFTLDTSGHVPSVARDEGGPDRLYEWSDLTPFQQGYVEGLFADLAKVESKPFGACRYGVLTIGFSDLAPETLARILKDCEAMAVERPNTAGGAHGLKFGHLFWGNRQAGVYVSFPPLTPYLGDDGLIYLREAS